VAAPAAGQGVVARLAFVECVNVLRKPGPVFNLVTAAAAADGADYFFRVNDDTEVLTPGWARLMADHLAALSPPNLGVVGPSGSHDASASRMCRPARLPRPPPRPAQPALRPPGLSAAAPAARRRMITHDFVHRTHLRVFGTYYPPVLSDWWMDDWISHVYPSGNALKLSGVKAPPAPRRRAARARAPRHAAVTRCAGR